MATDQCIEFVIDPDLRFAQTCINEAVLSEVNQVLAWTDLTAVELIKSPKARTTTLPANAIPKVEGNTSTSNPQSENGALSHITSLPSTSGVHSGDSTHRTVTTTGDSGTIATHLSASALLEILSTIVTAANPDTSGTQTSSEAKEGSPSPSLPPIQVQLQLNPQPDVGGTLIDDRREESDKGAKRKGKSTGTQGKGKDKQSWHYHLGGVRQRRVPLSPEIKEALEVAYVSRIMSKNFRKEGQPEKERISRITGLELEKVHEWFKNRRKKDKLLQSRSKSENIPRAKRGRKPIIPQALPSTTQENYISTDLDVPKEQ